MSDKPEWDETIEDLQLNGLKLIQKKKAFRFGMDSVLLAHFAEIKEKDSVVDLGTGNGVLLILLYGRNKGCRYYGIDIQQSACEVAQRNIVLNRLEDRAAVICDDALYAADRIGRGTADAVICNPPYGQPSAAIISPQQSKAIARTQDQDTLHHFLVGAHAVLKGKGKLYMVYPASQMLFLMEQMKQHHLEPKKFQLVYPYQDKPANLVLIQAVKDARPTLHPMSPLIIYESDGNLTNELKSVYHMTE